MTFGELLHRTEALAGSRSTPFQEEGKGSNSTDSTSGQGCCERCDGAVEEVIDANSVSSLDTGPFGSSAKFNDSFLEWMHLTAGSPSLTSCGCLVCQVKGLIYLLISRRRLAVMVPSGKGVCVYAPLGE